MVRRANSGGLQTAAKSSCKPSGSGSSPPSRASSPTSSPKGLVGNYSLDGVATTWDDTPGIRGRIRDSQHLLMHMCPEKGPVCQYVEGSKENVVLNSEVLRPVVLRMRDHNLLLPSIDNLIMACQEFFKLTKSSKSLEHCYQEAWAMRRLIGKLKSFVYKENPPQERVVAKSIQI